MGDDMDSIGRGIATIGVWGAVAVMVMYSGVNAGLVGFLGSICAAVATSCIWR